jgi:hypothetical protein
MKTGGHVPLLTYVYTSQGIYHSASKSICHGLLVHFHAPFCVQLARLYGLICAMSTEN